MTLSNRIKVTKGYKGGSKHHFWKTVKENDIVEVSIDIKSYYRSRYGCKSTEVDFKNVRTGEVFNSTMNMANNYLAKLTYEELNSETKAANA